MNLKQELNLKSNIVKCEGCNYVKKLKPGNNDLIFGNLTLKSFYVTSSTKKLYVFLSAIGKPNKQYPIFNRISWKDKFDGIKIFFDDPTRIMLNTAPCFYFGTGNNGCLKNINNIITNLKEIYNLNNKEITFISSSNGGFGALYLTNEFPGSKCIALCPQFDVRLFLGNERFNSFVNMLNIKNSLNKDEIYNRLNLYRIKDNMDSKFIIYSNIACSSDEKQIDAFCKFIGFNYKLGLNQLSDNFYLILTNLDNIDPHVVQPDENFCRYLDQYFWEDTHARRNNEVEIFLELLKKRNNIDFTNKIINRLFSVVDNSKKIVKKGDVIDVWFNVYVFVRVKKLCTEIVPSIRVNKNMPNLDINIIYDYVKNNDLYIDENDVWVNVYGNKIHIREYHDWLNNFIKYTRVLS